MRFARGRIEVLAIIPLDEAPGRREGPLLPCDPEPPSPRRVSVAESRVMAGER